MLNNCQLSLGRSIKGAFIVFLALFFVGFGVLGNAAPATASSKIMTTEDLELAMGEAAQEFVESVLDDYSDVLEDSFDAAIDPVKSAVKDLTKQMSKAAKSTKSNSEPALATQVAASQEALMAAMESFRTLAGQTESFKATLNSAPGLIEKALQTQLGAKFEELDTAVQSMTDAVDQLVADTEGLDGSDPEAVTAFTEHATILTAAIDAIDLAIDGFDS
jgi:hypothetical protein